MLRPHKGNSRVSFNDTLLNFGLSECRNENTLITVLKKKSLRLFFYASPY